MNTRCAFAAIVLVAVAASAATNLNSSRSNIYRLTYPSDLVTRAQARTILGDLDKQGPMDEAKLKHWFAANFRHYGVDGRRVQKLVVMHPDKELKETAILLLTNPADEAEARATTVRGSKSNSDN